MCKLTGTINDARIKPEKVFLLVPDIDDIIDSTGEPMIPILVSEIGMHTIRLKLAIADEKG